MVYFPNRRADNDLGQTQPPSVIMYVDFVTASGPGQPAQATATELIDQERQLLVQASGKFGGRGSRLTSEREAEIGLKGWLRGTAPKERAMRQSSYALLVFKSPLDAVRCAVEFQRALQKHNRAVPETWNYTSELEFTPENSRSKGKK